MLLCLFSPTPICMHAVLCSHQQQALLQDFEEGVNLKVAANWIALAIQLGVDPAYIDIIQKNNHKCEDACRELFCSWIKKKKMTGGEPRTRASVAQALRRMGEEGLADELGEK